MPNVFAHFTMNDLLAALRKEYTLQQLSSMAGITHQAVSLICKENPHWIYNNVADWKRGLKLKRDEGAYFELLAIIAAHARESEANRPKLLKRAFHLVGRLEEVLNPKHTVAASLVYWLDPVCSIVRNGTDLAGFPRREDDIPEWVSAQMPSPQSLGMTRAAFKKRVAMAWAFLLSLEAVTYNKKRKRWEKAAPLVVSEGKSTLDDQNSPGSAAFPLILHNYFEEFMQITGTDRMIVSKFGNFAFPRQYKHVVNRLLTDFIVETVGKLNYVVNREDLERLKTDDPAYYAEVIEYINMLKSKDIDVEPLGDDAMDSMVQMIVAARWMLP